MPFWQKTTLAPDFLIFSTISRSMLSSSSRNACICDGSVISILASISVFLISSAASSSMILAFSTFFGIAGWTGSLSTMMPSIISVSSIDPPCFLTTWMLSVSTNHLPSVFSATAATASTATSAMCSAASDHGLGHHRRSRDLAQHLTVLDVDLHGDRLQDLQGLDGGQAVSSGDDGRVNVSVDQVDGLLQQLSGQYDRGRGAVASSPRPGSWRPLPASSLPGARRRSP